MKGLNKLWPEVLPFAQYSYNRKVQTLTGYCPFLLMFRRDTHDLYGNILDTDFSHEEMVRICLSNTVIIISSC